MEPWASHETNSGPGCLSCAGCMLIVVLVVSTVLAVIVLLVRYTNIAG